MLNIFIGIYIGIAIVVFLATCFFFVLGGGQDKDVWKLILPLFWPTIPIMIWYNKI